MELRIFTVTNPKQPVIAVCELCGTEIKLTRHNNPAGEQWVNGAELNSAWIDHQLIDCKAGIDDEGNVRR